MFNWWQLGGSRIKIWMSQWGDTTFWLAALRYNKDFGGSHGPGAFAVQHIGGSGGVGHAAQQTGSRVGWNKDFGRTHGGWRLCAKTPII
jgi:hypothetical protein